MEQAGLSRVSFNSDDWHQKHPAAAHHLLGLGSVQDGWDEAVNYILCFFPDVDDPRTRPLVINGVVRDLNLSTFEQCCIAKMRMHRSYSLETLSMIWSHGVGRISQICTYWIPRSH